MTEHLGHDQAALALMHTVEASLEVIVTDCLRPALAEIVTAARVAAGQLEGVEPNAEALVEANPSESQIAAFQELKSLAVRYDRVRAARGTLSRLGYKVEFDSSGRFGEFKRLVHLWTDFGTRNAGEPPWPSSPVGKLIWFATAGAEPWMPTVEQQDSLARQWFEETRSRNAQALAGAQRAN